jgi:hypothetical protein
MMPREKNESGQKDLKAGGIPLSEKSLEEELRVLMQRNSRLHEYVGLSVDMGQRYGVNGWSFDEMEKMPLKNVFNPLAGIRSLKMGSVHVNHGHLISRDEDGEGSMH